MFFSPEGFIESLPEPSTYKHQEHYLCFDGDFDNEADADDTDDCSNDADADDGSIVDI